jgi:uncharacterized SAM-binding protein YcdF (DUF218 family)
VNELFLSLGISAWKPAVSALLLPPLPWIVLILIGAWLLRQRGAIGWLLLVPACASAWLASTSAVGEMLTRALLAPVAALQPADIARLKQLHAARNGDLAVVVLGGGREALAPEYGVSNLTPRALSRLRYGVWLSRETGIPLAYSGGVGFGSAGSAAEADIAARISSQEFNRPIKWVEARSRDTRENATFTIGQLRAADVRQVVVVTHGWHMPRAMRAFEQAVLNSGGGIELTAAPMGLTRPIELQWLRWLPSNDGQERVRDVVREWLAGLAGA